MTAKVAKQEGIVKNLRQSVAKLPRSVLSGAAILAFAAIGTTLLISSHAATPTANFEAEAGTRSGNASLVSDSTASGTSAVKFSVATSGGSCPVSTPNVPGGPDPWGGCWPGANTTGVDMSQCPGGLTASGSLNVTTAGTTISCKDITGRVDVQAANVIIKNCKIHDAFSGQDVDLPTVFVRSGNLTMYNTEMYRTGGTALGGDIFTAYNMNVHDIAADGVKFGDNVEVRDSYFHDWTPGLAYNELGNTDDINDHGDGGQLQSGNSNVTFRHNYVDAVVKPGYTPLGPGNYVNSALFLAPDLGPNGNGPIAIDKNIFRSTAYYPVSFLNGDIGQGVYHQKGYSVTNNRFVRDAGNAAPYRSNEPAANFTAWCGNVYNDNGAAISGPINTSCQ